MEVHLIPHAIFETTRSGFIQILHHCLVSWKMTPLYIFRSNVIYFAGKGPIKMHTLETFERLDQNSPNYCHFWNLWFGKWHDEFGKFSSEHLQVSKFVLSRDPFVQSKKCMSEKFTEALCVMTLKNDEKSEDKLFCRFKFDARNSINQSINQSIKHIFSRSWKLQFLIKNYELWYNFIYIIV